VWDLLTSRLQVSVTPTLLLQSSKLLNCNKNLYLIILYNRPKKLQLFRIESDPAWCKHRVAIYRTDQSISF